MTRTSVNRQPFCVWVLDNVGSIGVKPLRPEYSDAIPKVVAYCRSIFNEQVPFDYDLQLDDERLYCIEMTEKAYRSRALSCRGRSISATWNVLASSPSRCSGCGLRRNTFRSTQLHSTAWSIFPAMNATGSGQPHN